MTVRASRWQERARHLADELRSAALITDPAWHDAFAATPRHEFVPAFFDGDRLISPTNDTQQSWLDAVYRDEALLTQTRPHSEGEQSVQRLPTSSSSAPSIMAVMLERLGVTARSRVLEVGTGTGYNAALLCHRLGSSSVTSVDIDPDLVALARKRLNSIGHSPVLETADGAMGYAGRAPYDRILATCAVTHVPEDWIRQLGENGRIVAPLAGPGAALMVLEKTAPDEVTGHFDSYPAKFMPIRSQVSDALHSQENLTFTQSGMAHCGTTHVDPRSIVDPNDDLLLFLHLHIPGLRIAHGSAADSTADTLVVHTAHAMAEISLQPLTGQRWAVQQRGSHRIWDTVETAVSAWSALGEPDRGRLGITALDRPDRQYVWLDDPNGSHSWPLPL